MNSVWKLINIQEITVVGTRLSLRIFTKTRTYYFSIAQGSMSLFVSQSIIYHKVLLLIIRELIDTQPQIGTMSSSINHPYRPHCYHHHVLLAECTKHSKQLIYNSHCVVFCCVYTGIHLPISVPYIEVLPISIRFTLLAPWQSYDCPSVSDATLNETGKRTH